ncbi:MAG: aldehyde dehydrogenase family protein [Microthrixaceae bacterium]
MIEHPSCFIDGTWSDPADGRPFEVVDPSTEEPIGTVLLGGADDVDRAVAAARAAFPSYSRTTVAERLDLLAAVTAAYAERVDDLADLISREMGAPAKLSARAQAPAGLAHLATTSAALEDLPLTEHRGSNVIRREAIGVCGLITPWNWPANQIMCKVAPALAAGCTMVLKPSEFTPFSAMVIAEALDAAGVPAGVFNLVVGDGPGVGAAIAAHPDVDMVSFTGSTAAGISVAQAAATTVKRVSQELGGKSPNVILPGADLDRAVRGGVVTCMQNSGQSCDAPTRMLVPREHLDRAVEVAGTVAGSLVVGPPDGEGVDLGPVANRRQFERVQHLIGVGVEEGAELVCGGPGRPDGLDRGWFVRPTVFSGVTNDMAIARQEVFGPVLAILAYDSVDEAVEIANDTDYGLAAYVQGATVDDAAEVGSRLRAGQVHLNGAGADFAAPFGGFKQSGNGREWGREGLEEFLEVQALLGVE